MADITILPGVNDTQSELKQALIVCVYLFIAAPIVLIGGLFVLFISPIIVPLLIGFNVRGTHDRLMGVKGIDDRRLRSALIGGGYAFMIMIITFGALGAVTPEEESSTTGGTPTPSNPSADNSPTATTLDGTDSPIKGGTAYQVTVSKVVDGDTINVTFENGSVETVRFLGIDTPETVASNENTQEFDVPDTSHGRNFLLQWGSKSETRVKDAIGNKTVRIVVDPQSDTRGSHGRLLAYVYTDGSNLNQQLIKQGLARRYDDSSYTLKKKFGEKETSAQDANRRVWSYTAPKTDTPTDTPTSTPEPVTPTSTPEPDTPTPTPEPDTPTPTPTPEEDTPRNPDGDLDCSDFDSHQEAQEFFEANNPSEDPHRLDGDNDGLACEP